MAEISQDDAEAKVRRDSLVIPLGSNDVSIGAAADYSIFANNYGLIGAAWNDGDFNGDGLVTAADDTIWADNDGATLPGPLPGGSGAVPEPTSVALRHRWAGAGVASSAQDCVVKDIEMNPQYLKRKQARQNVVGPASSRLKIQFCFLP